MAVVRLLFTIYISVSSTVHAESEVCVNKMDPACKNPMANDKAAKLTDAQVESMDDGVADKMKLQLLQTSSAQAIISDSSTEEDRPSSMDEAAQSQRRREELGRLNQERRLNQTKKRQEIAAERAAELARKQQPAQSNQGLVMTPYGLMPAQTVGMPVASDGSMQAQQVPQMPAQQIPAQQMPSQMMPSQQTLPSNQAMQYQPVQVGNQIQYIPVTPQAMPMMPASGLSGSEAASMSSTVERRTVKGRRFSAQDAINNQESERSRAAERRARQKMKQHKGLALNEESVEAGKPLLDTEPTTPASKHPDVVGLSGDKAEKRQAMIDKLRTQTEDEVGYSAEAANARRDEMQQLLVQQEKARMAAKQYRMQSAMSRSPPPQVGGMPMAGSSGYGSGSVGVDYSASGMAPANTVTSGSMSMGYSMDPMYAGASTQALNAQPATHARVHAPGAAEMAANQRREQRQEMIRQHWADRIQFGGQRARDRRQQRQKMPQMMPASNSMPQYMPSSAVSPYAQVLSLLQQSKDPRIMPKPAVEKKKEDAPKEIELAGSSVGKLRAEEARDELARQAEERERAKKLREELHPGNRKAAELKEEEEKKASLMPRGAQAQRMKEMHARIEEQELARSKAAKVRMEAAQARFQVMQKHNANARLSLAQDPDASSEDASQKSENKETETSEKPDLAVSNIREMRHVQAQMELERQTEKREERMKARRAEKPFPEQELTQDDENQEDDVSTESAAKRHRRPSVSEVRRQELQSQIVAQEAMRNASKVARMEEFTKRREKALEKNIAAKAAVETAISLEQEQEMEEPLKKSGPHDLYLERESLEEEELHETNMKHIEEKKDQTMRQIYKNIDKENTRHDEITGTIKHVENQLSNNDAKSANEDATEHERHQKQMHHFEESIESAQAEYDEKMNAETVRHSRASKAVSQELGH